MRALMGESGIFIGNERLYFSYDMDLLSSGKYRLAGQLVALSLKFDGPGPQCMHPAVYATIVEQNVDNESLVIDDLVDTDIKAILKEVYNFIIHLSCG